MEDTMGATLRAAKAAHEANRVLCLALGDNSQPKWEDAPLWQRQSAVDGVSKIWSGDIKTPEQSHQSWMDQKIKDGWAWGPMKDAEKKLHSCIVPYDELTPNQRLKDEMFSIVVRAVLGID